MVPVWLSEDDLSCIICQGLLDWPTTLPCGHSFCLRCLDGLWSTKRAGGDGCPWACPICRKGASAKPDLHKNPLLQDLVDKYRQAALELEAGPEPRPAPAPRSLCRPTPSQVTVQKSTTKMIQELTEMVGQLVDVAKSLQTQSPSLGPGLESTLGILHTLLQLPPSDLCTKGHKEGISDSSSSEEEYSLDSPKPVTFSASQKKIQEILHNLEEIQGKLQGSVSWKETPREQVWGELMFSGTGLIKEVGPPPT
ncbi:E3 ubiquitin-protein ligase RNF135 [Apodemus speciosus]|uniref:E3 ubiquitin-protein ligase RNF135 n=1 Tax=Apodemus speciosus TaxID=105296 RepID=A0ABQ0FBA7_APOSI